jgi:hypothetical protein
LSRAVGNLPKTASPAVRKAVYDRARGALVNQLRSMKPPLPEGDILREQTALDAAVARIEAETAIESSILDAAKPLAPPTSRPISPRPAASVSPAPAQQPVPSAVQSASPTPRPAANVRPTATTRPAATAAPAATSAPPQPRTPTSIPRPAVAARTPVAAKFAANPPAYAASPPQSPPPLTAKSIEDDTRAPSLGAAARDEFDEEDGDSGVRVATDGTRPSAPGSDSEPPPPRRLVLWFTLVTLGGFVIAVAAAAVFWRQTAQDFLKLPSGGTPTIASSPPATGKTSQRVGDAAGTPEAKETPSTPAANASPGPAVSPAPQPTASAVSSPAEAPSPSPAPSAVATATPAPEASPAPTTPSSPAAANPAGSVPVAARAAILIAASDDPQAQPVLHMGTVVWSEIPAGNGQPLALKAVAEVPELKERAEVVISKNVDPKVPASHVIDVRFVPEDGSDFKPVTKMQTPLMHMDDGQRLDQLQGLTVTIVNNHFLVGLAKSDADLAHNTEMFSSHSWFDFPVLLADGHIAKLTIEKGPDGDALMAQALAAWK